MTDKTLMAVVGVLAVNRTLAIRIPHFEGKPVGMGKYVGSPRKYLPAHRAGVSSETIRRLVRDGLLANTSTDPGEGVYRLTSLCAQAGSSSSL